MKAFYRKTIASCISLIILFLTIGPAAAANVTSAIEIRGPVYNGSDIDEILTMNNGNVTFDATHFVAFYYETDPDVITENLTFK